MTELICKPKIYKLLKAGISCPGNDLKHYMEKQDNVPDWQIAWFGSDDIDNKFWQVFTGLRQELVPGYIDSNDLYTELWKLYKEVIIKKSDYKSSKKLIDRIDNFIAVVKKPQRIFYVMNEIKNLDIGTKNYVVGNVELFKLSKTIVDSLKIQQDSPLKDWFDKSGGDIVAKVKVNAAETQGANILGRVEIGRALNVILMGVKNELINRGSDRLFLWELGPSCVFSEDFSTFCFYANIESIPFVADISNVFSKVLDEKTVWRQVLDNTFPKDIQLRIERAIEWITLAIKEYSDDHKIIHLCTALEVLLLPGHTKGPKGELIALRQALVGQNVFQTPTSILRLYEKRGEIIHGGNLNIILYEEYVHLLDCCLSVLRKLVYLSQKFPQIDTLKELLNQVENKKTLKNFVENCDRGMIDGKRINDIKKIAEQMLKNYS